MAITNNLTNSSIRKYLPSKVISGFAQELVNLEGWLYDDGTGDPWWQGAAGTPVRWILTADVYSANHSSHLTRVPNMYTGLDVQPGMWVFSSSEPKAVRIVSIINKADDRIRCIVEDVDRYNTFADPTSSGLGIFAPGNAVVFFEIGDDGLPILNPLPGNTDISVVSQVEARFRVFNPTVENRFFQINHGFKEGQVLKINSATSFFEQATANDIYISGTVMAIGPGPNYFYLSPSTKIIKDLEPGLPGVAGDVIWLDPLTGDRTTISTGSLVPLYVKMTNSVPCYSIGSINSPISYTDTVFKINNELITLTGNAGVADLQSIIDTINAETQLHGVVASIGSEPNRLTSDISYPSSTPASPMTFALNGITSVVHTPSIIFGAAGQIGWWDIIKATNEQTHLHGIYGTFDTNSGNISFESARGDNITFGNIVPAITDGDDKTFTDMFAFLEDNPAATPSKLKLERADGGEIIVSDIAGSFIYDTGIQSSANGSLPMALVVDKTMAASSNVMVSNLPAMNALSNVRSGDQVFVQNGVTSGEWELYVKTGSSFTKISDYNSSNSDANTLSVDVDFSSTSPIVLGNISNGTRIVDVSIVVSQAFNNVSASLSVGIVGIPEAIMPSAIIDLTVVGSYESGTSYMYSGSSDGDILVFVNSMGSSTGTAKIIVSYL